MTTSTWRTERALLASATKYGRPAEAREARRNMTAGRLEEYIERTLASAPPLTPEQRDRLSRLFAAPTGGAAA